MTDGEGAPRTFLPPGGVFKVILSRQVEDVGWFDYLILQGPRQ